MVLGLGLRVYKVGLEDVMGLRFWNVGFAVLAFGFKGFRRVSRFSGM